MTVFLNILLMVAVVATLLVVLIDGLRHFVLNWPATPQWVVNHLGVTSCLLAALGWVPLTVLTAIIGEGGRAPMPLTPVIWLMAIAMVLGLISLLWWFKDDKPSFPFALFALLLALTPALWHTLANPILDFLLWLWSLGTLGMILFAVLVLVISGTVLTLSIIRHRKYGIKTAMKWRVLSFWGCLFSILTLVAGIGWGSDITAMFQEGQRQASSALGEGQQKPQCHSAAGTTCSVTTYAQPPTSSTPTTQTIAPGQKTVSVRLGQGMPLITIPQVTPDQVEPVRAAPLNNTLATWWDINKAFGGDKDYVNCANRFNIDLSNAQLWAQHDTDGNRNPRNAVLVGPSSPVDSPTVQSNVNRSYAKDGGQVSYNKILSYNGIVTASGHDCQLVYMVPATPMTTLIVNVPTADGGIEGQGIDPQGARPVIVPVVIQQ